MARLLAALTIAALCACTRVDAPASDGRHPWTRPNVLRMADISDPEGFNPLLSTMDLVEDLSSLVFSYLVIADDRGTLIGDLATQVPTLANGGISADGKTYIYHLHHGVHWQDGKPLTSRDVAFTWRAVMSPANNILHREGYDRVASIATPDATTVIVHLKRRYPPFVTEFFTSLQEGAKVILPEHLLGSLHDINRTPFNAAPVGSGPFRFVRWERGRGATLARYDAYFKGRPKLARIEFRVIPDDTTILNSIETHDVDLVVSVPAAMYGQYREIPGIAAGLFAWNGASVLDMNDGKPGLRDVEVRRAIAQAIDYDTLIAKISHGVGTPAHDIVPPVAIGYTANQPYRYDPAGARRSLDRYGWKTGADGIRAKGGERLDYVVLYPAGSAGGRAIAVQLQRNFTDIGVGLSIKTSPYNAIFSYQGPIVQRTFDFALYSYTLPWDPDNSTSLDCDQFSPRGENDHGFCDPAVDAGERAGLSIDDPAQRAAVYHRLERRIHSDVPFIPLYVLRRPTAINDDLKGFTPAPGIASWWNAWQWSI